MSIARLILCTSNLIFCFAAQQNVVSKQVSAIDISKYVLFHVVGVLLGNIHLLPLRLGDLDESSIP